MASGRDNFLKLKPIILLLTRIVLVFPMRIRIKLFEQFRMVKGKKGILIRYILLKTICKTCGDNVSIHSNVYIFNPQNLDIGDNVSIHPMCYLEAYGGLVIGNDVSIAHSSSILSVNHTWDTDKPIKYNDISCEEVFIEDDVWIGCGVRILAGVRVRSRSIVAAGAVVIDNVSSNSIVGGVPAKKIKDISRGVS